MTDVKTLPKGELPPPSFDDQIRFVGDLQRCDVKPGDRFVMTVERPISREMHEVIQRTWRDFIGSDNPAKLLVLQDGMRLGVIGPVDTPSAPADWASSKSGDLPAAHLPGDKE